MLGLAYWNVGVLPIWQADKRQNASDAISDFCVEGKKYTGSLRSLVFGTCDNGAQETGLFTKAYVEAFKKEKNVYPQLHIDHPMNDIIRVGSLTKTLHGGSSSCAFHSEAFEDLTVQIIPLYNWQGNEYEWWRQCWMYDGVVKKAFCNRPDVAAGPHTAGGTVFCDKTPFCMILFHTATSNLKGNAYCPSDQKIRPFKREASATIREVVVKKGLTLFWEKYDGGCPNVFMCGDFLT